MAIASRISVWADGETPTPSVPPAYWGLYFEAEEPNVVVNMALSQASSVTPTLESSTDGTTWATFDPLGSTPVTLSSAGDKVYFRAGQGGNTTFSRYDSWGQEYYYFTLSGKAGAHGNLLSILDGSDPLAATNLAGACFFRMFLDCVDLTSAPDMPATSVGINCCHSMFRGCTSLTSAPSILPATGMNQACYKEMFYGCTSLTSAPELPATALGEGSYEDMFFGCTSLTDVPELPATTAPLYCYARMFKGCTSLATGPVIRATTRVDWCMQEMFHGCASLATLEVDFTDWNPSSATSGWLSGVAATGTFKCPSALGDNSTITRGTGNCPSGWTVVNI